jgi:general L-amino acid transport system permease protein
VSSIEGVEFAGLEPLPPPEPPPPPGGPGQGHGAWNWMRRNLFANRRDTVLTVIAAAVVGFLLYRLLRFVFVTGRWEVVRANLSLFLVGRYPRDELWRVILALIAVGFAAGAVAGVIARRRADAGQIDDRTWPRRLRDIALRTWPVLVVVLLLLVLSGTVTPWLVALGVLAALIVGRLLGARAPGRSGIVLLVAAAVVPVALLPVLAAPLGWDEWGGLMLSLFIAAVSMTLCFPLGVLLALGRRSGLPALRTLSIGFVEFFRGVPLVVLVLMSATAIGFFFPQSVLPGRVVRVIVAFTIFTAAYVAEIVRGGLQSVPRGQTEAALALGLVPWRVTTFIVLPQALRNVIPALVGQFISLFKDTTLVFVIGILDLLSVAENVTNQPDFRGQALLPETFFFAAMLFWVGAYTMSRESQRLEVRLGVGQR